jgi:hypothetical protein
MTATAGPPPPRTGRKRRARLVLALVAGVMALLCLGGVGVFVSLYDNATKIKRSAPDAVTDNFLRAYLDDRDDKEASLYECKSGADFSGLSALRTEMVNREDKFHDKVSATWGALTVNNVDQKHTNVATGLIIAGVSNGNTISRRTETWTFALTDDDGWRVCSASKLS